MRKNDSQVSSVVWELLGPTKIKSALKTFIKLTPGSNNSKLSATLLMDDPLTVTIHSYARNTDGPRYMQTKN